MSSRADLDRLATAKHGGAFVAQALRDLGWTQVMLAEHLDRRPSTINDWIHNRPEPPKIVVLYLKLLLRFRGAQQESRHG